MPCPCLVWVTSLCLRGCNQRKNGNQASESCSAPDVTAPEPDEVILEKHQPVLMESFYVYVGNTRGLKAALCYTSTSPFPLTSPLVRRFILLNTCQTGYGRSLKLAFGLTLTVGLLRRCPKSELLSHGRSVVGCATFATKINMTYLC